MDWETFLAKAQSNLRVAQLAFEHKEYDPCVSCAYYAVFQAEIAALLRFTDVRQKYWKHDATQSEFNRHLIQEQKVFGHGLASVHNSLVGRRHDADYRLQRTSEKVAKRCLSKAEDFLRTILQKIQEQS